MPRTRLLRFLVATLLFATAMGGCTTPDRTPASWRALNLPGTVLILVSESEVEELRFLGEPNGGWAAATIGSKNGPVTGPVFPWRLEDEILVVGRGNEIERLAFIRLEQGRVIARRSSGQEIQFRMVKS